MSSFDNSNVESRINELKRRLEAKKNERNKAEAQLEMHQKQLDEVISEIKALGYEPEELPEVLANLEQNILDNLKEAERILNEAEPISTDEMMKRVGLQ